MKKAITGVRRFVGLDVHAETIAAAVAEKEQPVRDLGIIPNRKRAFESLSRNSTREARGRLAMRPDRRATRCTGS